MANGLSQRSPSTTHSVWSSLLAWLSAQGPQEPPQPSSPQTFPSQAGSQASQVVWSALQVSSSAARLVGYRERVAGVCRAVDHDEVRAALGRRKRELGLAGRRRGNLRTYDCPSVLFVVVRSWVTRWMRRRPDFGGAGVTVRVLRRYPTFAQLRLEMNDEVLAVDLVATPGPNGEALRTTIIGGRSVLVDSPHEILVNTLCALLSRSEARDLLDVRELLASGGDLEQAVKDAPTKDAGFSSLTAA